MHKYTPMVTGESTFGMLYQPTTTGDKQTAHGPAHIDYDVENIINAMQDMPAGREYAIYKFITELKADLGIVSMKDMFDCFYMLAGPSERDTYINWSQPGTYDITLVGATGVGNGQLNFNANVGWSSATTTNTVSGLNTNFNPHGTQSNFGNKNEAMVTGVNNILYNSGGSFGLFVSMKNKVDTTTTNRFEFGAYSTGAGAGTLFGSFCSLEEPRFGLLGTGIIAAQTNIGYPTVNSYPSLFTVVRDGYRSTDLYHNGDYKFKNNAVATLIQDMGPFCICNPNAASSPVGGNNVAFSAGACSTREVSFCYIGSKDIKPDIIYRRLKDYFHTIGYNGTAVTQTEYR